MTLSVFNPTGHPDLRVTYSIFSEKELEVEYVSDNYVRKQVSSNVLKAVLKLSLIFSVLQ